MNKFKFIYLLWPLFLISCQTRTPAQAGPKLTCKGQAFSLNDINNHHSYNYHFNQLSEWIGPKRDNAKGVLLLLHGLNVRPSKMNSLGRFLNNNSLDVLRASFAGHRGDKKEGENTTREIWLKEFQIHYCLAVERAEKLKVPLYFLGFSLGGILPYDFLHQLKEQQSFKKAVLLAPAIRVHWYSKIASKLAWLGRGLRLPSRNLAAYRSQKTTPLGLYRAMADAKNSMDKPQRELINFPTLILIDPKDELVSSKKLEKMIKKFRLNNWQLEYISNKLTEHDPSFHHLVIDSPSLGRVEWTRVLERISRHLSF